MTKVIRDKYYHYQHEKQLMKNQDRQLQQDKLNQQTSDQLNEVEEDRELAIDDHIKSAKKSGDWELASQLLDEKIMYEAKHEANKLWLKVGINPSDLTIDVLKRWKEEGEI